MSAYFVLRNRVLDEEAMQTYIPKATESLMAHGAEILVIADESEVVEGTTEHPRTIIIRFDSREQATACYESPAYREVLPVRLGATDGYGVLVDGFVMPG